MSDIAARRLDGVTVADVFTDDEAARAVALLESYRAEAVPAMFGQMLGVPLANVANYCSDPADRTPYYDDVDRCRGRYVEAFGRDPFDRVAGVLSQLGGGLPVRCPIDGKRSYGAGNVRWFDPGGGGLPAHAGNEFRVHDDPAAAHFRSTTVTFDHFSWFVVLQAPDEGGALSVYDLLYETHRAAQESYTEAGRDDSDFDGLQCRPIAPPAGSMVFFGGGWRWHRVDKVYGTRPRVTYGGFAGRSTDGDALHLWY